MERQDDPTRSYLKEVLWAAAMVNLIMVLVNLGVVRWRGRSR